MRPPAEINAEVVLPSGDRIRWDAKHPDAKLRPLSPSLETEDGKGFGAGSVALRRPSDRTYPELGLLNELILRTATGQVVYQGRAQGIPSGEEWIFECDGWWTHGEQRTFAEPLVDRELSAWANLPEATRAGLLATYNSVEGATTEAGSALTLPLASAKVNPFAGTFYDAGPGNQVGSISYTYTSASSSSHDGRIGVMNNDNFGSLATSADLLTGTNSSGSGTFTPTTPLRYATAYHSLTGTVGTADRFLTFKNLAVYGNTGIPTLPISGEAPGIAASEAIKYLAGRYCPKWDTSKVQATSYPIPHATWRDPITPAEAIRQLNSYHLWKLGVFEDRQLVFEPYDLSVADWQVASGIEGCRVEYQGDTTENIFNGCSVSFTDFDGTAKRITPDDTAELQDSSDWIAANQWGDKAWLEITVSWPASANDAVEIGRVALAAANAARRPSTITVPMHIKDINGGWRPSSVVRSGQTIVVTNQHTPVPRLITRTSWSNHSLTISTDNAIDTMSAFNARIGGALTANGLV